MRFRLWCGNSNKAVYSDDDTSVAGPSTNSVNASSTVKKSTVVSTPTAPQGPSPERAEELFNKYADAEEPDEIRAEGLERLYGDAGIPLDSALPWIMAWQFEAAEMLRFSRSEWKKGMDALQCVSFLHAMYWDSAHCCGRTDNVEGLTSRLVDLDDLLIKGRAAKKPVKNANKQPKYFSYTADPAATFVSIYNFCFNLGKRPYVLIQHLTPLVNIDKFLQPCTRH